MAAPIYPDLFSHEFITSGECFLRALVVYMRVAKLISYIEMVAHALDGWP